MKPNENPGRIYYRLELPHFDGGEIWQTVTFHLDDALPVSVLERWKFELGRLNEADRKTQQFWRSEKYLDRGYGGCALKIPAVARMVEDALLYFAGQRYELDSWVIMPNHVHSMFRPLSGYLLENILHSWKSYTAKQANRILQRAGAFWQKEFFDRYIRDDMHFANARNYIELNPVAAGLCEKPEDWPYSSSRRRLKEGGSSLVVK